MTDQNSINALFGKLSIRDRPLPLSTTPTAPLAQNLGTAAPPLWEIHQALAAAQMDAQQSYPNFGMHYAQQSMAQRWMPRNRQFAPFVPIPDPCMFLNPNHDPSAPRSPTPLPQLQVLCSDDSENGIKYLPIPRNGSAAASRLSESNTKGYRPYLTSKPNSALSRRRQDKDDLKNNASKIKQWFVNMQRSNKNNTVAETETQQVVAEQKQ